MIALRFSWYTPRMISRRTLLERIRIALDRSPVVVLTGARQVGKTTLARTFLSEHEPGYFDLEDPQSLARLEEPRTALESLEGLVVIDEIQRRPDLFPVLRVLVDRRDRPARFLILGSASGDLLRQSSESLAGRMERIEIGGFSLQEIGRKPASGLWRRGGFPRAFLARTGGGLRRVASGVHPDPARARSSAVGGARLRDGPAALLDDGGALPWADLECDRTGAGHGREPDRPRGTTSTS